MSGPTTITPAGAPTGRPVAMLVLVCLANFLNYLDRQVVSSVEHELSLAFELDKTSYGWLWSAFTAGYVVFAPLVGWLSDRGHRPRILAACVLVWSAATVGSGLAPDATTLFAMRFLIGVGEAGCLVVGPSLLADAFPIAVRGRALSLFYLGMPIGGAAGYVVGGWAAQHLGGFRSAFFVAGAPGVLLALAILRLPEPGRGRVTDRGGAPGLRAYLGLLRNRPYVLVALAQTFAVAFLAPLLHFSVRFFEAERGLGKLQATLALAACALVAGIFGAGISGVVGDRLARRRRGGHARVAAVGYGLALPFMIVGFSAPSPWIFLPALFCGAGCLFACMPAVNTEIANVVPAEQRAMGYALAAFVLHTLGDMVSPPAFGAVAETRGAGGAFLGFAALLVGAAVCAELAARHLHRADARRAVAGAA